MNCNFCGKSDNNLIAGKPVEHLNFTPVICDECVKNCIGLMEKAGEYQQERERLRKILFRKFG